jgi:hypothetical protein
MYLLYLKGAIVNEGGKSYIFLREKDKESWRFIPVEIIIGQQEDGYVEIKFLAHLNRFLICAEQCVLHAFGNEEKRNRRRNVQYL